MATKLFKILPYVLSVSLVTLAGFAYLTLTAPTATAAAAFRSIANTTYASRTNTVITAPAGIQNNDILLLLFTLGDAAPPAPTPPAGFTALTGYPVTNTSAG